MHTSDEVNDTKDERPQVRHLRRKYNHMRHYNIVVLGRVLIAVVDAVAQAVHKPNRKEMSSHPYEASGSH